MDYFLLLCSLLLPVVSAVEGKKSHLQLLFAVPKAFFWFLPSEPAVPASRGLGAAGAGALVEAPQISPFLFIAVLRQRLFSKVAIWLLFRAH